MPDAVGGPRGPRLRMIRWVNPKQPEMARLGRSLSNGSCYRFATVSPGKSGQTVAPEAGIHARQVADSGQVARNPCPQGLGSGSGESWFDPRRGNSKRDITMSGVALRPFWTLFPGWSGEFCSRDRSNCRRHMMFRRLARWRPMRTTPAFKQANPGIPRRSGGMASRGRAVALAGLSVGMRRFHRRLQLG